MKRFHKLSIMALLTVFLLSIGASSALAKYGWGDTMGSAEVISGSFYNASVPLEGPGDQDWYLLNNFGSEQFKYSVLLIPPSGIDLILQIVRISSNNTIIYTTTIDNGGPGGLESFSGDINPYEKVYFQISPKGPNDYDPNRKYSFEFRKSW